MSPGFDLSQYEPVEERLARFWADHPKGRISTRILPSPDGTWIILTEVWRDIASEHPASTGHAQEVIGQGNVNRTSALENCETSSIGRALADLGYAPKGKRPSREEMSKVAGSQPGTTGSTAPIGGASSVQAAAPQTRDGGAAPFAVSPATSEESKKYAGTLVMSYGEPSVLLTASGLNPYVRTRAEVEGLSLAKLEDIAKALAHPDRPKPEPQVPPAQESWERIEKAVAAGKITSVKAYAVANHVAFAKSQPPPDGFRYADLHTLSPEILAEVCSQLGLNQEALA